MGSLDAAVRLQPPDEGLPPGVEERFVCGFDRFSHRDREALYREGSRFARSEELRIAREAGGVARPGEAIPGRDLPLPATGREPPLSPSVCSC